MRVAARLRRWHHLAEVARFRRSYDWDRPEGRGERTLVLHYNGMWGVPPEEPPGGLPPGFELTSDRRRFREARAVVFHIPSLGSLDRVRKFPGQVWVAQSLECELNHPRLLDPDFMARFDLRAGYRRDSDVVMTYCRPEYERLLCTPPRPKSKLAALFISGRHDQSGRLAYAAELMRHLEVHSFGRRLRNRRLSPDHGTQSKLEAIAPYRFTLAFENARAPDYVTEKFFEPLVMGSVPVYLGAPNVADFAPGERCYIDVADFSSPAGLARHLTELAGDEDAYAEYLAWKDRPLRDEFLALLEEQRTPPLVRLCERLA